MDDFRTIYRMLKTLQKAMDYDEGADPDSLSARALGVSSNRLNALWKMLADEGYVTGVVVRSYQDQRADVVYPTNPKITLKGLDFLQENSLMKKAAQAAIGIITTKL